MSSKTPVIYLTLCAAFIATLHWSPYELSFVVKALPMLFLLYTISAAGQFGGKTALAAAVVFSAIGDIVLELTFRASFMAGLGAFLIAHLWYCGLFLRSFRTSGRRIAISLILVLYPTGMAAFLWPYLGALQVPVAAYVGIITLMLLTSINRTPVSALVIAGAGFFVASDSILALNKFYAAIPGGRYWIMLTYYAAQYLIVTGILREKALAPSR